MRVLSIQSDVLGHSTYCRSLRHYFSTFPDIDLTSCWYREGRSFANGVINKVAHTRLPFLGNNSDYWRARVEWSTGHTSKALAQRKLQEGHYDLLHFHTQAQAFGSAKLMKSVPTVVSMDMTAYQVAREYSAKYPETYKPNIAMERDIVHTAAHLITWSEWAKHSLLQDHGVPDEKVTVITPGARLETFALPLFEVHEKPRILFIGHDFKRKGGLDLLDVFTKHFTERAELHLVTSEEVGTSSKAVHLHTGISAYSERWHELLWNSDLFVMPSYAEALGLVFQEAAGYGLALIGSNEGGIPEMISEAENGFVIKPGDRQTLAEKIDFFLADPEKLLQARRQSYAMAVERFDSAKNFRRMAELFKRVGVTSW